ncbi:MAG: discoidin domain-containing protein, partial [Desulfobacterota bacterium]|nr:discoidin domain-containing protein [Thermodesulfobacteriota bacterium]
MRSNSIDRTAAVLIKTPWPLVLIFLAAVIVRVVPLTTAQLWRDEAVVGIMSLRVLAGDFPVFFFGQNFMGALEAYLSAVLVLLGGPQAWVLELLPVLLSLFFLFLIERLGNRLLSPSAVRTALLYLALPPVFLLDWAQVGRSVNLAALGLLAGLGWWTNHLAVVYLLPVFLFLWLHDKKVFLRPAFYLLVLFFLFGQLPQFLYQIRQPGPGLGILSLIVWPDWPVIGRDFFGNAWPILGGIPYPLSFEPAKWLPYLVFLVTTGLALGYAAWQRRAALAGLLRLNLGRTSGLDLLGLVFIAALAINFLTVFNIRLNDNDQKYLLPVYSALPFFLALFLERLDRRRRGAGLLVLFLLLGVNLWGILLKPGWPALDRERRAAIGREKTNDLALWQALRELGLTRIQAGEELGARLTFISAEQIIAADPYQSVSLRYGRRVEGTDRPAYLFQGDQPDWENNLQALGGGWRKTTLVAGYVLYADFRPPAGPWVALPASGWTAPQGDPEVPRAFDGDFGTSWQVPQQTGTCFTLDLGRRETISKVVWWPGDYPEVPGGYRLEVSETGKEWQVITRVENYRGPFFWSGPGPVIKVRRGRMETSFDPVSARFVRLVFFNGRPGGIWSINEMVVYAPWEGQVLAKAEPPVLRDLVLFLKEEKRK